MKLKATGMGRPRNSSNECEIPIPDEASVVGSAKLLTVTS